MIAARRGERALILFFCFLKESEGARIGFLDEARSNMCVMSLRSPLTYDAFAMLPRPCIHTQNPIYSQARDPNQRPKPPVCQEKCPLILLLSSITDCRSDEELKDM